MPHEQLAWNCKLDIDNDPKQRTKTGIVCTIGPKTNNPLSIAELRRRGMSILRMNFSHGTHEFHRSVIQSALDSDHELTNADGRIRPLAIALDTKGPEIRSGETVDGSALQILKGHVFVLTTDDNYKKNCTLERVHIDYKQINTTLDVGSRVYIDDGNLQLQVLECLFGPEEFGVRVRSLNSHRLLGKKGVNLPYANVEIPALTEKDKQDLRFALENPIDIVFASFIRKADDVLAIKKILGDRDIKIISKIENHEGVKNFDSILEISDGIMVARGDLGVEIPPQKVFLAQKMMISKCNAAGKPVICATQMLESMTLYPRPTRAEASDVANAVLDGADCVMLSAETASGAYPNESVSTMYSVCAEAEASISYRTLFDQLRSAAIQQKLPSKSQTIGMCAVGAAIDDHNIKAIIVLTISGDGARQIARFRPSVPVIVVTRDAHVARCMHLYRGLFPLVYKAPAPDLNAPVFNWNADIEARLEWAMREAKIMLGLLPGDGVILVHGERSGSVRTNTMRIVQIGSS